MFPLAFTLRTYMSLREGSLSPGLGQKLYPGAIGIVKLPKQLVHNRPADGATMRLRALSRRTDMVCSAVPRLT